MKIKVCGLKYKDNITQIAVLDVDMLGFIFYKKSSRYVGNDIDKTLLNNLAKHIKKVAVFVDEPAENILSIQQQYEFDFIQLHGDETTNDCKVLKSLGINIIKAFSVDEFFDFSKTKPYQPYCNYFLFDTKGKEKGGNGYVFNWALLNQYTFDTPFLLSGGIGADNMHDALQVSHPQLSGFDINSKIEISPAIKSVQQVKYIIEQVKYKSKQL